MSDNTPSKCSDCKGQGTKPLFTSCYTCETCGGKGVIEAAPVPAAQSNDHRDACLREWAKRVLAGK